MLNLIPILKESITITAFVFTMMLLIEYINVQTKGLWQKKFLENKWKQYLIAGFLGAIPGCLGAFTVVTLFSHKLVSFGALVTTLIATSGDEAFVMFSKFPKEALFITIALFLIAIVSGYLTDLFYKPKKILNHLGHFPLHKKEVNNCNCFDLKGIKKHLKNITIQRVFLIILTAGLLISIATEVLAGDSKLWIKNTLLIIISFSLFVVLTVPDHFLKEHLWNHIVKVHIPRIFLWIFGTLIFISFLTQFIDIELWINNNMLFVLIIAVVLGLLPTSGPHLIFITLFIQGSIPISIILASSISQDGHASLPLLAESKRSFIIAKLINMIIAFIVGIIGLSLMF